MLVLVLVLVLVQLLVLVLVLVLVLLLLLLHQEPALRRHQERAALRRHSRRALLWLRLLQHVPQHRQEPGGCCIECCEGVEQQHRDDFLRRYCGRLHHALTAQVVADRLVCPRLVRRCEWPEERRQGGPGWMHLIAKAGAHTRGHPVHGVPVGIRAVLAHGVSCVDSRSALVLSAVVGAAVMSHPLAKSAAASRWCLFAGRWCPHWWRKAPLTAERREALLSVRARKCGTVRDAR